MSSPRTELFQQRGEIVRQTARNRNLLACARMQKAQLTRMQALALLPQFRLFMAVDRVAQDRMTAVGHVDADLMRPSRLQSAFDKRIARKPLQYAPMRHGAAAVFRGDGHFLSVRWMAADRRINGYGIVLDIAADDTDVGSRQTVILELRGKTRVRQIVFRRNNQSGRI